MGGHQIIVSMTVGDISLHISRGTAVHWSSQAIEEEREEGSVIQASVVVNLERLVYCLSAEICKILLNILTI